MEHLHAAGAAIEADLAELASIASARRRGEELVAVAVGAHSAALERVVAFSPDLLEADGELAEVLWAHRPLPAEADLLDRLDERVDRAFDAIEQTGVPGLRDAALRLLQTVNDLYGAALARAFELLDRDGQKGAIRLALEDELVSSALVMHGLHPDDIEARARRALAEVAHTLASTGPAVEWVGIDADGVIRLRAGGEPERDRWRVALAAERAVKAAAPDATDVIIDGAGTDRSDSPPEDVFIPLSSIGRRDGGRPKRWIELPELASVAPGQLVRVAHDELRLLACRIGSDLYVAVDPFNGDQLHLRLAPDQPPTVESSTGTTFVFDDPLPVQSDGDLIEVAVP